MAANFGDTTPIHAWSSRLYETEHDLQQMQDLLMEARARTDDWRYAHVGELLFNFFMVACHLKPQEHIRLWHAEGRLVGYAILGEDPSFDCQVLPEYEWSGIEAEAMDWAETRMAELRQARRARWGGNLVSGARQDDARRIAFLEQHGFRYCGDFAEVNMLRSLDEPIPEAGVPAGYQVRAVAETGEICKPCRSPARGVAAVDCRQRQRRRLRVLYAAARLPARSRCGGGHTGWRHRRVCEWLD